MGQQPTYRREGLRVTAIFPEAADGAPRDPDRKQVRACVYAGVCARDAAVAPTSRRASFEATGDLLTPVPVSQLPSRTNQPTI